MEDENKEVEEKKDKEFEEAKKNLFEETKNKVDKVIKEAEKKADELYKKEEVENAVEGRMKLNKDLEDGDFSVLSKPLEQDIVEKDEDAQEVIDAVPFMKALLDALESQMIGMVKAIIGVSDKVDSIKTEGETTIKNYTGCVVK